MPRQGNDRLLLGLKGSLNEYEFDRCGSACCLRRRRQSVCRNPWSRPPVGL